MMKGMRKAGQTWLGKLVVGVLFFFLIVSFAIFGIGDIFQGGLNRNVAASVGSTDVSVDAVRNAYQNEIQRLIRQVRRSITPDQARAFGIDRQVVSRLVTEATLDEHARRLGLSVSDETVANAIRNEPAFRDASGNFSVSVFNEILRSNGLTEAGFVQEQRRAIMRQHIGEAMSGAVPAPTGMMEAVHRYGAERRGIDYLTLPAASVTDIPEPTPEALTGFFAARQAQFRAPEYRRVTLLVLDAAALAKPEAVSDADAQARYEQVKASRYGTPERRTIQQISFPNAAEAAAAVEKIKGGATFEEVAAERGVTGNSLELGTFTREQLVDPAIREAAFSLEPNTVSAPIAGRFGPVLLRVTSVTPENVRPFSEVATEIKAEIARERARAALDSQHDQIEDDRLAAKPLAEIAKARGLDARVIEAIDRSGSDKAGKPVADLPQAQAVIEAVFNADVGVDTEALRLPDGGYVWYEVNNIEPARDRPLEEVRDEVIAQWRADQITQRLSQRARELVTRLDAGEDMAKIAAELNLQVQQASDIARDGEAAGLPRTAVAQIFGVASGKAGTAASGADRIVFKVTSVTVPPFVRTTQEAATLEERLRTAISDDLLGQFVLDLQSRYGLEVNQQAIQTAIGGGV